MDHAAFDEVAAVGAATRPNAKALLQTVPSVLVELIVGERGEAGVRHVGDQEQRGFVQVEAGAGGTRSCIAAARSGRGSRSRVARVGHGLFVRDASPIETCR